MKHKILSLFFIIFISLFSLNAYAQQEQQKVTQDEAKLELSIFFDENSAVIHKKYEPEIDNVVATIVNMIGQQYRNNDIQRFAYGVIIDGHVNDSEAAKKRNKTLSQKRAKALKDVLVAKFQKTKLGGILFKEKDFKIQYHENKSPFVDKNNQVTRDKALNRRAVTSFTLIFEYPINGTDKIIFMKK